MDARGTNVVAAFGTALGDAVTGAVEAATGLSGAAPAALAALLAEPGMGLDALSRTVGVAAGGVRLADRLAASGLVERGPGRDGRAVSLHLTRAGEQVAGRVLAARADAVRALLAVLDRAERASLVAIAERVLAAATTDRDRAEQLCRLCDTGACPSGRCPVEQAVP